MLTTVLDLLGFVLLVLAIALLVAQWSTPAALAAAGAGFLAVSWYIDRRADGATPQKGER